MDAGVDAMAALNGYLYAGGRFGRADSKEVNFFARIKVDDITDMTGLMQPEIPLLRATLFPNPFHDKTILHLKLQKLSTIEESSLRITDLMGKQVFQESLKIFNSEVQMEIDKCKFPHTGIYFYELISGSEQMAHGKMILE